MERFGIMRELVFVIEQLHGGGAERVTATLMNRLCHNCQIHLISTYYHDDANDFPTDINIKKHMMPASYGDRFHLLLKRIAFLKKTISDIHPHCVISLSGCGTNALLTVAMIGSKIPLILSERNDPHRDPKEKLLRILRMWTYTFCQGLVFQTREAQKYFPSFIHRKSTVICNPLTGALPEESNAPKAKRIINCCRLVPQKNLGLLFDAFSDIADKFPDISLVIWGEGPEREKLEKRIAEMGLGDRIFLPGYSQNIYLEMNRSMLFVSSSDYEGISNSMLEAIALGVPTICTDCPAGGARETIRHGENGLLVPVGDRQALAEAMGSVLSDPELAEKLSLNGRRLRDEIAVGAITKRWEAYIDQVVSRC